MRSSNIKHSMNYITSFLAELFFADYSEKWKAERKFAVVNLRKFGFGMPSMEPNIQMIINKMIEQIRSFNGSSIDLQPLLSTALAEIAAPIVIAGNLKALIKNTYITSADLLRKQILVVKAVNSYFV